MIEYRLHGPPGAGKTTALATTWIPRAVARFGADAVVVSSLTRTAARELVSRDLQLPREQVGTLHAHAYRALGRPKLVVDRLKDWNAREPRFALSGVSTGVDEPFDAPTGSTVGDKLLAATEILRHRRVPRDQWPDDAEGFFRAWEAWKAEAELADFTELIERALVERPIAPGAPQVLVCDESQDSSELELALIRSWAQQADHVVLAGDVNQSLYRFRGADPSAFLGPDLPAEHNYELKQSYRLPRAVHAVAARWISQVSVGYHVDFAPRDAEGEVVRGNGSSRDAEGVVDDVQADLDAGRKAMILAPCAYLLRPTLAVLRKRGLLFHNPWRRSNGSWNPLRGGAERLTEFLRPDRGVWGDQARLWAWEEIVHWLDVVAAIHLPRGLKARVAELAKDPAEQDAQGRLRVPRPIEWGVPVARAPSAERISEVLGAPLFDELAAALHAGAGVSWLEARLLESKHDLMAYAFAVCRASSPSALLREPQIVTGTIHSTKGSESASVHLLPDLSPSGMAEWCTGPGEARDSVIRTLYVGLTRARERLVLHRPATMFNAPWNFEIP